MYLKTDTCKSSDGYLEIKRDRWIAHEEDCKFIAVKHTGEKTAASTKPRPRDMIPEVRIDLRCKGNNSNSEPWNMRVIVFYQRGTLEVTAH